MIIDKKKRKTYLYLIHIINRNFKKFNIMKVQINKKMTLNCKSPRSSLYSARITKSSFLKKSENEIESPELKSLQNKKKKSSEPNKIKFIFCPNSIFNLNNQKSVGKSFKKDFFYYAFKKTNIKVYEQVRDLINQKIEKNPYVLFENFKNTFENNWEKNYNEFSEFNYFIQVVEKLSREKYAIKRKTFFFKGIKKIMLFKWLN